MVLLDSATRLGRALQRASAGVGPDPVRWVRIPALYPPKRSGGRAQHRRRRVADHVRHCDGRDRVPVDTVVFEEFKGTGNAELKAGPADIEPFWNPARTSYCCVQFFIITELRRVLSGPGFPQAIDLLMSAAA